MEFLSDPSFDVQELIGRRAVLHSDRVAYRPRMPAILKGLFSIEEGEATDCLADAEACKQFFPHSFGQPKVALIANHGQGVSPLTGRKLRVGIVFSGGPAPGGHNVLTGLLDFLQRRNVSSELVGFLAGPGGLVRNDHTVITQAAIDHYRNLGGFHLLGTGRTKIESAAQLAASLSTVQALGLDGLVIVGGDDSNTNAAILAEYFLANGCRTGVVGVPKTIDGDLRCAAADLETSFGFDTATKVYSSQVANLCFDAISALKTYHIVRVMGRDASHITLEVALQTHPNLVFISEEVGSRPETMGLMRIVEEIVDLVVRRAAIGKDYGVVLVPEGLVAFVPDVKQLIAELNELLANAADAVDPSTFDTSLLSKEARGLYEALPDFIRRQLMAERDPHGNVQVAAIETERLLGMMVRDALALRTAEYRSKFSFVPHYFGYEGRCAYPSDFDCDYCYTLGATAAALIEGGRTGMVVSVRNLVQPPHAWAVGGTPLTSMMNLERRKGKDKPVIKKKLVDLDDAPFRTLQRMRGAWMLEDAYRMPGPVQHGHGHGHQGEDKEMRNFTLMLEAEDRERKKRRRKQSKDKDKEEV